MGPSTHEAQPPAPLSADTAEEIGFLQWIVRLRWLIFAVLGLLLLAGHNGQWRIGRDSSLYREVARNLAHGQGYTFRGEQERQIYPGLPFFLMGIEKVFGAQDPLRPTASLIIVMLMGAVTLLVIYHLIRTYYPPWMAICVTAGVGINNLFLEYTHELMADLPFLLGACLWLLGIARLGRAQRLRERMAYLLITGIGIIIAVSMRPTFMALAAASAGAGLIGLARSRRRIWYGGGIAAIVLVLLVWRMVDPRLGGQLFIGKYEASAIAHLKTLGSIDWPERIERTFSIHLPEAFFGFELLPHMGILVAPLVIASSFLLLRHSVLWTLYVLITLAMTVLLGNVPRYFMMILPLLLVEWAVLVHGIARRLSRIPCGPEIFMAVGLGTATIFNLGQSASFILAQHGIAKTLERKTFLETYRNGRMRPLVEIGQAIAKHVPPGEKVLGLEPRILTFLGGRNVFHTSEVLPKNQRQWRSALKSQGFHYCIYGSPEEKVMGKLIHPRRPRVIIDRTSTIRCGGLFLARMRVKEPSPLRPAAAGRPARRRAVTRPAAGPLRPAATHPARQPANRPQQDRSR